MTNVKTVDYVLKNVQQQLLIILEKLKNKKGLNGLFLCINIDEFIEKTTLNMAETLLIKSQKISNRIIDNEDVSAFFKVNYVR
jgi:uncharacterized membrane-anchored protein